MLVIRRLVDRRGSFTALMLPGEPARIFPTSDYEHARLLQIYKQDRPYEGIHNDFASYALGRDTLAAPAPAPVPGSSVPSPASTVDSRAPGTPASANPTA